MPPTLSGPPSLARKANKLNGIAQHQMPATFEVAAEVPPPPPPPVVQKRPRGRPRKIVKVEEVDDAEILRPKRAPKPSSKAQSGADSPDKPSTRSGNKRKHNEMESALDVTIEEVPKRKRGRPPKVKITIPAPNSSRLRKVHQNDFFIFDLELMFNLFSGF